jgi:hypothetical protein
VSGARTSAKPWKLKTPPGSSAFEAYRDDTADPPALVVQVGSTQLRYQMSCIDDLHAMLKAHGDWMPLGGADENKPVADGTVEAWGRSQEPVGASRLKKTPRPIRRLRAALLALGPAGVEHAPKNNRCAPAERVRQPKRLRISIRQRSPTGVTDTTSWPHSAALRGTFRLAGAWSTITRSIAPTGICSSASFARTNVNGQTSPVRSSVSSPGDNSIG